MVADITADQEKSDDVASDTVDEMYRYAGAASDRDIRKWWKDVVKYPRGTFSARRILSLVARTEMDRGTMAGMRYRIDAAEKRAATAEEQVRDAQAELDFWFDRRKLAHDQVDAGVMDAVQGYLRTSRAGGMSSEDSDLVERIFSDMTRLSLFADLFARASNGHEKPAPDRPSAASGSRP